MSFSLGVGDWWICALVLSSTLFFGLFLAIKRKSSANSSRFFLADRRLSWPLVGASLFATNIGAEHLVGLSGDSYRYGLSAGTVELTTCWTLGFAAFFFPLLHSQSSFHYPRVSRDTISSHGSRAFFGSDVDHFHHHEDGVSLVCGRPGFTRTGWLGRDDRGVGHGYDRCIHNHCRRIYGSGIHGLDPGRNNHRGLRNHDVHRSSPSRRLGGS